MGCPSGPFSGGSLASILLTTWLMMSASPMRFGEPKRRASTLRLG
jgi:hypothetical protein